jgi:hypothetical protein
MRRPGWLDGPCHRSRRWRKRWRRGLVARRAVKRWRPVSTPPVLATCNIREAKSEKLRSGKAAGKGRIARTRRVADAELDDIFKRCAHTSCCPISGLRVGSNKMLHRPTSGGSAVSPANPAERQRSQRAFGLAPRVRHNKQCATCLCPLHISGLRLSTRVWPCARLHQLALKRQQSIQPEGISRVLPSRSLRRLARLACNNGRGVTRPQSEALVTWP